MQPVPWLPPHFSTTKTLWSIWEWSKWALLDSTEPSDVSRFSWTAQSPWSMITLTIRAKFQPRFKHYDKNILDEESSSPSSLTSIPEPWSISRNFRKRLTTLILFTSPTSIRPARLQSPGSAAFALPRTLRFPCSTFRPVTCCQES